MPVTTLNHRSSTTWDGGFTHSLSIPSVRSSALVLAIAVLAFALRATSLSTYGLSEDEINKVRAIDAYRAGDFTANAEHPMLMKLAIWGSVAAADAWNRTAPAGWSLPLESAVRLPNAAAGAATAIALFGVTQILFGATVATVAAAIWALDVNAIATNRIGKEDTFLLFFFLLAVFCYERAKQIGPHDLRRAQRWYTSSGAVFGLMLASKYMPQYLGIYALFNLVTDVHPGPNRPNPLTYYGAMCAAFLAVNPSILLPGTWHYIASYLHGDLLVHHGYLYNGSLYVTNIPVSPLGVPAGYYLRLLVTKVPLVVLGAAVPGSIELIRRRGERGFVLLRLLTIFLLLPYSLMAAKFLRYALPMIATLDMVAAVGLVAGLGWLLRKQWLPLTTRLTVSALAGGVFLVGLIAAQQAAAPFYSTFENAIGERLDPQGTAFPEQTYDYGVREAAAAIASAAAPSALVLSDALGSAAEYLRRDGRPDLAVRSLSASGVIATDRETWVIVQDEHLSFENELFVRQLRATHSPWREIAMDDLVAVQLFRIPGR